MIRTLIAIAAATTVGFALLPPAGDPGTTRAVIRATAVPLSARDPAVNRTGALRYLGGWWLAGSDPRFGGLSSMAISGDRVLALSDAGGTIRFRLRPDGRIDDAWIGNLPDGPGTGADKQERDSESMTMDPATGRIWVGFEWSNSIWRYDPGRRRSEGHVAPRAMRKWPSNSGSEAMVRLPDGRFIVLSEDEPGPDNSNAAILFTSDPTEPGARAIRFGYRPPAGYAPTDAAMLPDGRLLVLHRRFTLLDGVSAVLSVVDIGRIERGKAIEGTEIARLAPPLTVDNMEALAVTREQGRTIIWIASDDNFNLIQRTLLMRFALDE